MLGAIRIYQLPSAPGATDDLEITTRDVEMEGPRAFTPPQVPVNFRLGRSQGSGSDLEILLGDLEGAPQSGGMMRGMALLQPVAEARRADAVGNGRQRAGGTGTEARYRATATAD